MVVKCFLACIFQYVSYIYKVPYMIFLQIESYSMLYNLLKNYFFLFLWLHKWLNNQFKISLNHSLFVNCTDIFGAISIHNCL